MNSDHLHRAWADVDLHALQDNLAVVRRHNQSATITAVIKSNAYGHGMEAVAHALSRTPAAGSVSVDRFAVATVDEAIALHMLGTGKPVLVLQGFSAADQARYLVEAGLEFVIHADFQLALLKRVLRERQVARPLTVWLKVDTGMHRLGVGPGEASQIYRELAALKQVGRIILISHLACADAPNDADANARTQDQLRCFNEIADNLEKAVQPPFGKSLAASAGILAWPATHFEHVRPGIMLYGGSPMADISGPELGLKPVMTLRARLLAIKQLAAGDSIGYGATYTCDRPTRIGVVSIGYGDGYPRSAPTGTPVLVKTRDGYQRSCILGRVSMDMITIDLGGFADSEIGDEVVLWGESLPADEVARFAGTISYELFCQVTGRVTYVYR